MSPTTAAIAANQPKIVAHLKGFLLLQKDHDVNPNCLSILGLFPSDFPSNPGILWDHNGITAQTRLFRNECTCNEHKLDSKLYKMEDGYHVNKCAYAMAHKLLRHPCLLEIEDDGEEMTWGFQWPRAIEGFRPVIATRFKDAENDVLWPAFKKSWAAITDLMPEPEFSLAEKTGVAAPEEEEWAPVQDEFDLDFDAPAKEEDKITIVHGAGNPEIEEKAQAYFDANANKVQEALEPTEKSKPGRPKGTSAKDKEAAKELAPADFAPVVNQQGKKVFPSCRKFAAFAAEELGRLCSVVEMIQNAEDNFPVDTIESLKNSLDRLALRAAHLQYKGRHEMEEENTINPLLEVTLCNVSATANAAVRDLALAPEKPASWETYSKTMKETLDVAKAIHEVISQTGAGPAVQEPPRLKDMNGKVLVP